MGKKYDMEFKTLREITEYIYRVDIPSTNTRDVIVTYDRNVYKSGSEYSMIQVRILSNGKETILSEWDLEIIFLLSIHDKMIRSIRDKVYREISEEIMS